MLQNRQKPIPAEQRSQPGSSEKPEVAKTRGSYSGLARVVKYALILAAFILYERYAPQEYRVSTFLGAFEGNTESAGLRAQVEGLTVKLAAEKAAEEKMQNDVNDYKQKLDIEQHNTVNAYKQKLDIELQNAINAYKLQLDAQLEEFKNRISLTAQKAVDINRLNLERRNKMTTDMIAPFLAAHTTTLQLSAMSGNVTLPDYGVVVRRITDQVASALDAVEAAEAGRRASTPESHLPPKGEITFATPHTYNPLGVLDLAVNGNKDRSSQQQLQPSAHETTSPQALSTPFQNGVNDRTSWEQWFSGLQGEYRSGAFYWSAMRNDKNQTPSCENKRRESYGDFTDGCRAAKKFLTQSDQKRASDADYKSGWNSVTTPANSPPRVCSVIGVKPDDSDGGLRIRAASSATSKVLGVIPYDGRGVTNIDCACDGGSGKRCRVSYNGREGWV